MSLFGHSECDCGEQDCYVCSQRMAENEARRVSGLIKSYNSVRELTRDLFHYHRPQYRNGRMIRQCLTCGSDIEDAIHVRDSNWALRCQTLTDQVLQFTTDDIQWLRKMDAAFKE
jgi:hypothetical protein